MSALLAQEGALPTAACPVMPTRLVVLPAGLWAAKRPTRVNCPICGKVHVWDPSGRMLTVAAEHTGSG